MDAVDLAGDAGALLASRDRAARNVAARPWMTPATGEPRQDADAALIERLRARDHSALETLMERYSGRLYRVAFGITRNHAEAEEVVQDAFIALFRKVDTFEGRSALGTWLYRVAANAALIKRRGKRVELETSLEDCLPTFLADGHREGDRAWVLADWSGTPESEFLSGEARHVLESALERLPEHYRALLVLRDVEEMSNEAVAEILGESVSSVKSRLHRARMALREILTRRLTGRGGALPRA
jgi:RNA polymerase sigma-70 factor (ECF subfamily)